MIHEYLSIGAENAITANDLCDLIGIHPRELSQHIMRERRSGYPICASCNSNRPGYFLAEDRGEMEIYTRALYRRLGELAKTYRACKTIVDTLPEEGEQS